MGIAVIPAFPDWLSIAVNPASIQVYTAIPAWPPFAVFAQKARFAVYAVPDLFAVIASRSDCFARIAASQIALLRLCHLLQFQHP